MMGLMISQKGLLQEYKATSPMPNPPPNSLLGSALHSSHSSFPILAVALIGILATGFLLVSYYIFVIKCCLNWHRIDLLRRFSFSMRNSNESLLLVQSTGVENRGLDEAVIRLIPVLQFKKSEKRSELRKERSLCECAVCLNEFQEEEKLRVIPNCSHVFHIDCIDIWLQNNANCPLCRTSISAQSHIMAPIFSPRNRNAESFRDEDYVVIEIGEQNQERVRSRAESVSPSPRKLAIKEPQNKKKSLNLAPKSMGDECIDIRPKDEKFAAFQPMRRSFSMDSAADPILQLAVQEMMQSHQQVRDASPSEEDCSSRFRRSFFTFGHGRSSRSTVSPIHLDP